jgi:hypothetical protein
MTFEWRALAQTATDIDALVAGLFQRLHARQDGSTPRQSVNSNTESPNVGTSTWSSAMRGGL